MKRITLPLLMAVALTILLSASMVWAAIMSSNSYQLSKLTLEGSGGSMASTKYKVSFTAGQTGIGPASGSNYKVNTGYWSNINNRQGSAGTIYLPAVLKNVN